MTLSKMGSDMIWKNPLTRYVQDRARRPSRRHIAGLLITIFLIVKVRQRLSRGKSRAMSVKKGIQVPGFTTLSSQVFVKEPENVTEKDVNPNHPDVVLVYGWGDGLPKHIAKYTDGFRVLFPHARQFIILSPIAKALFSDLSQRSDAMIPLVKALFPDEASRSQKILAHTMSNTGAINYSATLANYRKLYNEPMPHELLSMDSTPGSTDLTRDNLQRWSRAMAYGTAAWFPWPFVVTQSIWAVMLLLFGSVEKVLGKQSAGGWGRKAVQNPDYELKSARKLYMYSKEDDLILYKDIEVHEAETRQLGWEADSEIFEGTGHVGHMRVHGEQYWGAILASWNKAVAKENGKA